MRLEVAQGPFRRHRRAAGQVNEFSKRVRGVAERAHENFERLSAEGFSVREKAPEPVAQIEFAPRLVNKQRPTVPCLPR